MKVVAFNGSPNKEGNTAASLEIVAEELKKAGIEVEVIHIGNKAVRGCLACGTCGKKQNEQCAIATDDVNQWIQKAKEADGILFGAPVHFAGIAGTMKSFMDRLFYVCMSNNGLLRHKVGAAVVAVRRSGGVTSLDTLNHFLMFAEMIIPTSNYWNVIHGTSPKEATQDAEGVQIMQVLGKNMAWMMKLVESGKGTVEEPQREDKVYTSFIR
ncbi:MAG: flavodoxin family protein [Deferribacteraceae bacterium]|nr:flavodoxin family protein [Deferribacteraceae bacterium]